MSPKNELSSTALDRLFEQFLGNEQVQVYELHDKSIVALTRNDNPTGSVLVAVAPKSGAKPSFAVYSTKPSSMLPNEEADGGSGLTSLKPDYYLRRLKHAKLLTGLEAADGLAKLIRGSHEQDGPLEALMEYMSERSITISLANEPQVFLEPEKADIDAAYKLLVNRKFTFQAGKEIDVGNPLVSAVIMCRGSMENFPKNFITMTIGPTNDTSIDFDPHIFKLRLRDSAGQEYAPDFSISDELLSFTDLKEGETYTFIKA